MGRGPQRIFVSAVVSISMGLSIGAGGCTMDAGSPPGAQWETSTVASDSLVVRELAPGIWLHTSWRQLPGGLDFPKNGLLVSRSDGLWLVDTAWGHELTEDLLDWIDSELGVMVSGTIVTHFHDDSMGGTLALQDRGIPFWSHPLTMELGVNEGVPLPQSLGELTVGESVVVEGMEVFFPGPAHSEDNLMVWLPEARILFGGCAVRPGESSSLGNTADANVEEWPRSILRVRERFADAEIVVPSHGSPGDRSLLDHTIALFSIP